MKNCSLTFRIINLLFLISNICLTLLFVVYVILTLSQVTMFKNLFVLILIISGILNLVYVTYLIISLIINRRH